MVYSVLMFAGILGMVLGPYWLLVVRPEQYDQNTLLKRLGRGGASPRAAGLERTPVRLSRLHALNRLLARASAVSGPLDRMITESGLKLTVGVLVLSCALAGALTFLVIRSLFFSPLVAAMGSLLVAAVPVLYVQRARRQRLARFEEQFPEAIELLARALRAGHAFPTGLQMVADEVPDPIGGEFKLLYDRQSFGMPLGDALKALGERIPLLDARFFATAVLTQRESGGNLSEVLLNLASVIRDRFKVKRQVRVVTAHGRFTGWVLCALPPALAGLLYLVSPDHINTLLTDPLGVRMVGVAVVMQVAGTLVIRKLVNVPY